MNDISFSDVFSLLKHVILSHVLITFPYVLSIKMSKCFDIFSLSPRSCLFLLQWYAPCIFCRWTENQGHADGNWTLKAEQSSLPLPADNPETHQLSFCVSILIPVTDYNF